MGNQFTRTRRLVALLAAAALAVGIAAAPVAAGNTRLVSIGSTTDCTAPVGTSGLLTLTEPVTTGGLTAVTVQVQNCGGQNLSNAIVTVGAPSDASLPAVTFPDGSTFDSVTGANASGCSGIGTGLLTCTYKALRAGAAPLSFTTYINAASAGTLSVQAVVQVNEKSNDGGTNTDTFDAYGGVTVGQTTCDSYATWLNSTKRTAALCGLTDPNNANGQTTSVKLIGSAQTSASVSEAGSGPTCTAPSGLTCFGDYSIGAVPNVDGSILEWTIQMDLSQYGQSNLNTKKLVIYHWFSADYTLANGTFIPSGTPLELDNTNQYSCKTRDAGNGCIVSVAKSGSILTVVFRTPANGSTRLLG